MGLHSLVLRQISFFRMFSGGLPLPQGEGWGEGIMQFPIDYSLIPSFSRREKGLNRCCGAHHLLFSSVKYKGDNMYTRILVTVDGSATSEHALRHAIGLAKGLSAALRVVHVVDMGVLPLGPELAIDIGAITKARRAAGGQGLNTARATRRAG